MTSGSSVGLGAGELSVSPESTARVLVTDAEQRAVLAACRGLRSAGFLVSAVAAARPAPGHWSRSCSSRYRLPHALADEEAFVNGLERILHAHPHALLLAGTDASLLAVSKHRKQLERHTSLGLPPHPVVVRSLNKLEVGRVASSCGLSPPETAVCAGVEEALHAASRFGYPVVVKPHITVLEVDGVRVRLASVRADDAAEVAQIVPGFGERCLVQPTERGPIVSYAGVMGEGRLTATAVSRYHRTWPPDAGNASFSETIEPPRALGAQVLALLTALGWRGVFELELIAREGGHFSAIDFNPRVYGSMALAIAAGVNIPAIWARSVLGERFTPVQAGRGYLYRREDADLRNAIRLLRARRIRPALAVARPQRRVTHAFFTARDPAPAAAHALLEMRNLGARFADRTWAPAVPGRIISLKKSSVDRRAGGFRRRA
jgi:predicted ATP-grasp superfamily ATP-dependent carboligase